MSNKKSTQYRTWRDLKNKGLFNIQSNFLNKIYFKTNQPFLILFGAESIPQTFDWAITDFLRTK